MNAPRGGFSHERRAAKRYRIQLPLTFSILKGPPARDVGLTRDISSSGVLISTERPPAPGEFVLISIEWPVPLSESCALRLTMCGYVVRSGLDFAAVAVERYEFRTRAGPLTPRDFRFSGSVREFRRATRTRP